MPSVRCPYCHQQVDSDHFDDHLADHQQLQADGQQKDYVTLPPEQRSIEDLTGVPVIYIHEECGDGTQMPEEIVRSYLKNPHFYGADTTFCASCMKHVPYKDCFWEETGENLQEYFDQLRGQTIRSANRTSDRSAEVATTRNYEYPRQPSTVASKSNGAITVVTVLATLGIVGLLVIKKIPAAAMKQAALGNNVQQQRLEQEKATQELNEKFRMQIRNGEDVPDALLFIAGIDPAEYKDKQKDLQAAASLQEAVQLENAKQFRLAVEKLDQLIERSPESPLLHNSKAWILATCSDDAVRDGKIAVEHATRACQLKAESPAFMDTLAAAYAEAGDFENALKTIDNAINLAKNKAQRLRFESRRSLYEDHKPFRG